MRIVRNTSATIALASLAWSFPGLAQADSQPPAPEATSGDIVVTALRREQQLQDVSASISAVTGNLIERTGITDLSGVAVRTPGVFLGTAGSARPVLYVRAVGTRQVDPGSESSVGVFVDDIYQGHISGQLSALKDIERVEVLKGPQGTLYGRNTIGGAINIVTAAPTHDAEAYGEVTVSNRDGYDGTAAVSGPIAGDDLLGRIVGFYTHKDGYFTNVLTGHKEFGVNRFGGRLKLQAFPSQPLRASLLLDYVEDNGSGSGGRLESPVPGALPGILLKRPGAVQQVVTGSLRTAVDVDGHIGRKAFSTALKLESEHDAGTITSITAYRNTSLTEIRDFDASSLDVVRQDTVEHNRQFTQEIRFVSDPAGPLSLGGKLDSIVGLFYYHDASRRQDLLEFGNDSLVALLRGGPRTWDSGGRYRTESIAAFADFTWHFTDQVSLALGGRYTHDTKRARFATIGDTLVAQTFSLDWQKRSWDSFDPKATLTIDWAPDVLTYATVSRGFKSGGFQFLAPNALVAQQIFNPEKITHYEIGAKTRLFDRLMTFNVALFHDDFSDLQLSRSVQLANGSFTIVTQNAAQSKIEGAEAQITLTPAQGLTFDASYQYLPVAKYTTYRDVVSANPLDYSGTRMVRAPRHTFNIAAQYTTSLGSGELTLRADYNYRSRFFHEVGQGEARFGPLVPLSAEPGYGLVNLGIGYETGPVRLTAFVDNLADKRYGQTVQSFSGIQFIRFPGAPRTFGLTLRLSQ